MAGRSVLSLRIAWEATRKLPGHAQIHIFPGDLILWYWRQGLPTEPADRAGHLVPAGPILMVGFRARGGLLHICISRDVLVSARDILPLVLLKLAGVLWIADRHAPPGSPAQACALLAGDGEAVCVEQLPWPSICPDAYHARGGSSG
jgi:hypothetical protein